MDTGGEIRLGSALFTLVEPHVGHEVAYNRWYERDHFYAGCMVGPWLFAGRRWVATRDLKDARSGSEPELFGGVDRGSYLALYWVLEGKHDEHFEWGLRQVKWLHANDRMYDARDHVHTLLYRFGWAVGRDDDGVPPELALDHPYTGLVAEFVERPDEVGWRDLESWFSAQAATVAAVGQTLLLRPIPLPPGAPVDQPGLENLRQRSALLRFVDGDPIDAAEQLAAQGDDLAAAGLGRVLWRAPFRPTTPGSDTDAQRLR